MPNDPVRAALTSEYVKKLIQTKARQITRKPGFNRSDQPDLEHDLVVYVLKQADRFEPDRASVNTFIARVVDSGVAMICRDRRCPKRAAGFYAQSLDDAPAEADEREIPLREFVDEADARRRHGSPARSDCDRAELAVDLLELLAALPPDLRDVAVRLADGCETSVAREFGVSRRQVRKAVATIRKHFEENGLSGN